MNQPVQQSSDLPELPTPERIGGNDIYGEFFPLFTADQMREYARAAIAVTQVVADQITDEQILELSAEHGVTFFAGANSYQPAVKEGYDFSPEVLAFARALLASNAGKASSDPIAPAPEKFIRTDVEFCGCRYNVYKRQGYACCNEHSGPAVAAIEAVVVPEGWKLVPIEPTPEMMRAYRDFIERGEHFKDFSIYKAIIEAAPTAQDALQKLTEESEALGLYDVPNSAISAALAWDEKRCFIMPYAVRDPLRAMIASTPAITPEK